MQFRIDREISTIIWLNGADLASYSLYDLSKSVTKAVKSVSKRSKVKSS